MKACHSNACIQGRAPCPTPTACELPEPAHTSANAVPPLVALAVWAALSVIVFAAAGLIAGLLHNVV